MVLRTFITWTLGIAVTVLLFPFVLMGYFLDKSGNAVHSIGAFWARALVLFSGVKVEVRGLENIPSDAVVFASNHRGAFDIPALQGRLPVQFRWIAKKSLFNIPLVGWAMRLAGYIAIDRGDSTNALRGIEDAAQKIKSGTSVLIFPEGTRSAKNTLLPFKRGGFLIAIRTGALVVPVAIKGTEGIMKKGGFSITPSLVSISICPPINTAGLDAKELMDLTKKAIEKGLHGNG